MYIRNSEEKQFKIQSFIDDLYFIAKWSQVDFPIILENLSFYNFSVLEKRQ